ncbi:MAG: radical SAM protein [Euryarchaeota archaeon]|nr:radical SAM protein [Euryarchaeota archaeon]
MLERNVVFKDFRNKIRVALVYPNFYVVGMANLGFQIVYNILNSLENVYCERLFLDFDRSLETNSKLGDFDIIAFSWQFELDALNILKILHRNGIPLRREERKQLVIVGGPCTVNPYPLKRFIDVFLIGEAEANVIPFIERFEIRKNAGNFSDVEGAYISALDNPTKRAYLKNLNSYHPVIQIMSPETAFGETFLLEVSRGCARGCRFCMGCFISRPPRERGLENLKEIVNRGIAANNPKKITILGASVSDYSQIDKLCKFLLEKNLQISIPSLRADNLTAAIVDAMVKSGQKSLTLAPESNERLRAVMNKKLSDGEVSSAIKLALEHGIKKIKLYFMIGTPGEKLEDIYDVVNLVKKIEGNVRLSINPFVPKPHTPFQWFGFEEIAALNKKRKIFEKLRSCSFENFKEAFLQATIARGDEQLSRIIEKAFYHGGGMGAFRRAFREEGVEFNRYVKERAPDEALPWDKIDAGVKKKYLIEEYEKSLRGEVSDSCKDGCKKCGVCNGGI